MKYFYILIQCLKKKQPDLTISNESKDSKQMGIVHILAENLNGIATLKSSFPASHTVRNILTA